MKISFLKQTRKDIILPFHVFPGLVMNLQKQKQFCRKPWENEYEYLQIDIFAQMGQGKYTIRNWHKNIYKEFTDKTTPFWFHESVKHSLVLFRPNEDCLSNLIPFELSKWCNLQKKSRFGKCKRVTLVTKSSRSFKITRQIRKATLSWGYEKSTWTR